MTRQILALLVLVALIAGIFRAIQQNAMTTSQESLRSQTSSLVTSVPPTATFAELPSTSQSDTDTTDSAVDTTVGSTPTIIGASATPRVATLTPRVVANGVGSGPRPVQFPATGIIDELDVFSPAMMTFGIIAGLVVIVAYIGGRRR